MPGDVGGTIEGLGVRCTSCFSDMAEWGRRRSVSSLGWSRWHYHYSKRVLGKVMGGSGLILKR
jgi:hypothetical protein